MKGAAPRVLLGGALLLAAPGAGVAQVSVNPGALDQLRPEKSSSPRQARPNAGPAQRAAPHPAAPAHPAEHPAVGAAKPGNAGPSQPTTATAVPPKVPPAPPTPPVLPPPAVNVPTAPPPPLPAVPIADDAPDVAEPIPNGLRVTFGKDRADLNLAAVAAIREIAAQAKGRPGALDVTAYAAGSPDDPSTPRRLSLSRALAVRAVLLHEGIESPRIYVRALGASPPAGPQPGPEAGPPDRVDVTQQAAPAQAGTQVAAPAGTQAAGK